MKLKRNQTGREMASATTFSLPGIWTMELVNSARYARCLCWRADQRGLLLNKAWVNGLWSVNTVNSLPCSMNLKWRTDENAARSSLSKAEYFSSASESFLEKKDIGDQDLSRSCCRRTAPMWVSEASRDREIAVLLCGWTSSRTAERLGVWLC